MNEHMVTCEACHKEFKFITLHISLCECPYCDYVAPIIIKFNKRNIRFYALPVLEFIRLKYQTEDEKYIFYF